MKIAFYLNQCGMGNNGGTRTIVKSCEVLNQIGHEAYCVASIDRYTWDKHPEPLSVTPNNVDALVACSVPDAFLCSRYHGNKFWWLNSWDICHSHDYKYGLARSIPCITNSIWLTELLKRNNIKSTVCHAGLDHWTDLKLRGDKTTIGFLYNQHHKTKWKYIPELIAKFPEYDFIGFGDCEKPDFNCRYIRRPSHEQKEQLFSQCHIWVASTESEGFHNVGAEAGACGCLIMCNRLDSNGMSYATEGTADRFGCYKELVENVMRPNYGKVREMQTHLRQNIGTRERCMNRLVEVLSQ